MAPSPVVRKALVVLPLALAMLLAVAASALVGAYVAYPQRGHDLPGAPRLSRELARAAARAGLDDDGADWAGRRSG